MNASSYGQAQSPPAALPGFASIARHFDPKLDKFVARITVGETYVTTNDEVISTVLGSCICACIRDARAGIGGMNHFMLPGGESSGRARASIVEQRFGVAAMETLINGLLSHGAVKSRLEVKIFGGSELLGQGGARIGPQNAAFAREFLRTEGLALAAEDCGGPNPRRILFSPADGRVMVRYLPIAAANRDLQREASFARDMVEKPPEGDVELFD